MAKYTKNTDEFTPWEQEEIFALTTKFGGDYKEEFRKRLLHLLRTDRKVMHSRLNGKIKQLFLNLE